MGFHPKVAGAFGRTKFRIAKNFGAANRRIAGYSAFCAGFGAPILHMSSWDTLEAA